jgi:hypothetical protein
MNIVLYILPTVVPIPKPLDLLVGSAFVYVDVAVVVQLADVGIGR